jgi:hypothetical protein
MNAPLRGSNVQTRTEPQQFPLAERKRRQSDKTERIDLAASYGYIDLELF